MKRVRGVMKGFLVVVCCVWGWYGTLASRSSIIFSSPTPNSRYHATGRQPVWGFRSHTKSQAYRTRRAVRRAGRPLATAIVVAPTTSHLETGRTPSGVMENAIEGVLQTFGAFLSGGLLGGVAGMFVGATFGKVPDVSLLASMKAKTGQMAGDWGKLTAVFTGFTQLSIVVRGRNDQWDQVLGACGAGAYLNRGKGPRAMLQGAASYGLFSLVFAWQKPADELDVVDVPVYPKTD